MNRVLKFAKKVRRRLIRHNIQNWKILIFNLEEPILDTYVVFQTFDEGKWQDKWTTNFCHYRMTKGTLDTLHYEDNGPSVWDSEAVKQTMTKLDILNETISLAINLEQDMLIA